MKNPITPMLLVSHFCKNAYTTLAESTRILQTDYELNVNTNSTYATEPPIVLPVIDRPDPFLVCVQSHSADRCSSLSHCVTYMGVGVTLPSMNSIDPTIDLTTCIICEYARLSAISMLCQHSVLSVMKFTKFLEKPLRLDGEVRCLPNNLNGFECIKIDGQIHHLVRRLSKND